ncbi:hypothetical protein [Limnobacter sp.]|uniref:hypothetical protein n=1 Tax=Limnobacter sp. TaxID=2003368 RepID=UPI002FE156B9
MVGIPSSASPQSDLMPRPGSRYSLDDQDFSLSKCVNHTIRKAGYKPLGNGLFVRTGWLARTRTVIEGNNADARYHRAAYESSQRVTAAVMAEKYRANRHGLSDGDAPDLSDNTRVKSRFYCQDNLRFNPQFSHPRFGLSSGDKRAAKLSRWAHYANGVTELGAAPTGLLLKVSRNLFTPNRDDKAMGSQLRVLAALPVVAGLVSLLGRGVFIEGSGRAFKWVGEAIRKDILALVCSFSAVSAVSALVSLAFVASSRSVASRSRLSPALMNTIQFNHDKHIHRLYLLLNDAKDKQGGVMLITKALNKKIPASYRDEDGNPSLLNRLFQDVRQNRTANDAKRAMQGTIGSYLTEQDCGRSGSGFLDSKVDKAKLLARENHFVALTNLIEHTAIHADPNDNFKDVRHHIERGAEFLREKVLKGSGSVLNVLGCAKGANKLNYLSSKEYLGRRDKDKANPAMASKMRYSADNILNNAHQYGPLTRGIARFSEGLRVFNHAVLLSFNYQLTRPITWLAGLVTEYAFNIPNSRVTSFSIGRAIASSIWAGVDAFLLISLAAGNGVAFGGKDLPTAVKFPLEIPLGCLSLGISIISTAAQMLLVAIPAAVLMGVAKGACRLEGWDGNIGRPLERLGSRRNPMRWA